MLVRHLSYFVTIARERRFAKAAAIRNVAQPTLSAAIRGLEEDLGSAARREEPSFSQSHPRG